MVRALALLLLTLLLLLADVRGVKFELPGLAVGTSAANRRCVSLHISAHIYVKGTYSVGDGENQRVDIEVIDLLPESNKYYAKSNLKGDGKFVFTTQENADVLFCFTNTLLKGFQASPTTKCTVNFKVETGAEAKEDTEFAKENESLKPAQLELRRLEKMLGEINDAMEYLRGREVNMRSTNESTNLRVMHFAILSMCTLGGVGLWQMLYLKRYFQEKKLI